MGNRIAIQVTRVGDVNCNGIVIAQDGAVGLPCHARVATSDYIKTVLATAASIAGGSAIGKFLSPGQKVYETDEGLYFTIYIR